LEILSQKIQGEGNERTTQIKVIAPFIVVDRDLPNWIFDLWIFVLQDHE
jgi:hypothetical protein